MLKVPGGLEKWWKETGFSNRAKMLDYRSKESGYTEFKQFFFRLVCLSSVRAVPDPFHTWSQIDGHKQHHMAAGHTKAKQEAHDNAVSICPNVGELLQEVHHAYKILFFNKDQIALLTTDKFPFAIFMCDFGAGSEIFIFY